MKKAQLIKIIKEEISNVMLEKSSEVDDMESNIKKLTMKMFKALVDAGVPKDAARKAALDTQDLAFAKKNTSEIPALYAQAQKQAQLKHIGVNNKTPTGSSSAKPAAAKTPSEPKLKLKSRSLSQGKLDLNIGPPRYRQENGEMIATVTDSKSGKSAEGRGKTAVAAQTNARAKLLRMLSTAKTQ